MLNHNYSRRRQVAAAGVPDKPTKNRKLTLFFLLLTALLPAGFYFKDRIAPLISNLNQPIEYHFIKPYADEKPMKDFFGTEVEIASIDDLSALMSQQLVGLQGRYGIYFKDLDSGEVVGINHQEVYDAASVGKIIPMALYYRLVEKGQRSLTDEYALQAEDVQDYGTGSLRYQPIGSRFTYQELLELAGKQSDNTADHVLRLNLDQALLQRFEKELGANSTDLEQVTSTPADIGLVLEKIYNDEVLGKKYKNMFYDNLTDTLFEDRIPKGIPTGVRIVHKIGNGLQRSYNDCGIVFAPQPFILCVMCQDASQSQAMDVIPKIARAAFEWSIRRE
jgi:beta-lactamase class A